MMRPSKPALFLFLILVTIINVMICVVQGEAAVTSEVVVVGGSGSGSGSSATIRRGDCDLECNKEGNNGDGSQEAILENEDYVYTNSLP
ncbi:hypothetical protein PIB30_059029 [Stylosanthes scabra]|uniref:Uncharacterized protein n=1 Tax=Stylosanthes scabra TaxID=79078 RepID=A0ABU6TJX0_9FABA|nr:hypothetical protein [Stylosanthes scabra]